MTGFENLKQEYIAEALNHFQEIVIVNAQTNEYQLVHRSWTWDDSDIFEDYTGTVSMFVNTNVSPEDRIRYEEFMNKDHWNERASRTDNHAFTENFRLRNNEGDQYVWFTVEVSHNVKQPDFYTVFFRRIQDPTQIEMLNSWYIEGHNPLVDVDYLTKLMNRSGLDEHIKRYLTSTRPGPGVLLTIDIDNFKLVNDVFGHDVGDMALLHLADMMRRTFRDDAILGRNGGDEFMVFMKNVTSEDVEPLLQEFTSQDYVLKIRGRECHYSISVGAAEFPTQAKDMRNLCRMSDAALYSVKINQKHGYRFYNEELKEENRTQLGFNITDIVAGIPGALLVYKAQDGEDILFANNDLIHLFECDDLADFTKFTKGSFRNMVHPDDRERVFESIWDQVRYQQKMTAKRSETYDDYVEYRIITKKGNEKYIADMGRLVHSMYYGDIFYVFIHETTPPAPSI